ncbi:MAG: lipoyl(octanoyl) transferase, partial [Bacteroidota bacterium]
MSEASRQVILSRIGPDHTYQDIWSLQTHLQQKLIRAKRSGISDHPGYVLLVEHAPVYTIGKSGSMDHLRISQSQLESEEIEFFKINRGGDITYHGPGQITGYLILDLDQYYHDLHRYVRDIEEVI